MKNLAAALAKLEATYGTVTYAGHTYYLTQQAYVCGTDDPYYTAMAVRDDGVPDEDGWVATYSVIWCVPQSTIDYWDWAQRTETPIDEYDACDWDHPDEITPCGSEFQVPDMGV